MDIEDVIDETVPIVARRYGIDPDQAYYLVAERYRDVVDAAFQDGTTDPRALARLVFEELRAEADHRIWHGTLDTARAAA